MYDFEDYDGIIKDVMSEEELSPRDIPNRTRRQGVRGYGKLKCKKCNRTWSTYWAHVVIDLRKQKVVKIYKQKCKRCKRESVPTLREEEFTEMVEKAIEQERYFRNRNSNDRNVVDEGRRRGPRRRRGRSRRPPHENTLCEKCGYGKGRNCWERY